MVPEAIRSTMAIDDAQIVDAKDWGSDVLFENLPVRAVVKAEMSRLVADLNRAPDNRGPKGVVAGTDYRGRNVYRKGRYPTQSEIDQRVACYHAPYHERLAAEVAAPGIKGLFDCHSLNGIGPVDAPDAGKKRCDVVLSNNGDRRGRPRRRLGEPTSSARTIQAAAKAFSAAGFSVSINAPYVGGYITVHYGRELRRRGGFALQIEMNQDLYLNSQRSGLEKERGNRTRGRIEKAFAEIASSALPEMAKS